MQNETQALLAQLEADTAAQYGASSVAKKFNVTPEKAQRIVAATKEEISFLDRINVTTVVEQQGEVLGLNATGLIAKRTNTSTTDRSPNEVHSMTQNGYLCSKVEYDTAIKYATLDAWARKPNFRSLVQQQTRRQIALNQIMIGFHGASVAAVTDPAANPQGQDVAEGWLKKLQLRAAEQYMTEGDTAGEIRIGAGGDFSNLDVAVASVVSMIPSEFKGGGDLVAIIGSELLATEKVKFYDANATTPTEKSRVEDKQVIGTYGGLPAFEVPHFPARGILVTSFDNLSIYIQESSIRRQMIDNPKRDQYENFYSMNMDYVLEEVSKAAAVHAANVKLPDVDALGDPIWA